MRWRASGCGTSAEAGWGAGAELHYFYLRGLGEVPRLMLELAEVPYDSVMYFSRETKEYKEFAPFGQMPLYRSVLSPGSPSAINYHLASTRGVAVCRGAECLKIAFWHQGQ